MNGAKPSETMMVFYRTILSFFQKPLQQEGEEIRESVKLPVPPDVLVAQFDAVLHVGIGIPLNEIVQRGRGVVLCLHLHRYQRIGITNKKVHFQCGILALVEIQLLVARLAQHLTDNVFVYCPLVGTEVLVGTQVFLCLLV